MATLSRAALKADQAAKWPNNDTNAITPQRLRQPVIDVVDSAPNIVDDGRTIVVANVEDMLAYDWSSVSSNTSVNLLGYYIAGDGGGQLLYVDKADTTTADNGVTVFVASDGTRLKSVNKQIINVKQGGAKGDYDPSTGSGTDDTAKIQACLEFMADGYWIEIPSGDYKLTDGLVVPTTDKHYGSLSIVAAPGSRLWQTVAGKGVLRTVTGGARTFYDCHFEGLSAQCAHSPAPIVGGTAFQFNDVSNSTFKNIYVEADTGTDGFQIGIEVTHTHVAGGYRNHWYGCRARSRTHSTARALLLNTDANSNFFFGGQFQSDSGISAEAKGEQSNFFGTVFEGTPTTAILLNMPGPDAYASIIGCRFEGMTVCALDASNKTRVTFVGISFTVGIPQLVINPGDFSQITVNDSNGTNGYDYWKTFRGNHVIEGGNIQVKGTADSSLYGFQAIRSADGTIAYVMSAAGLHFIDSSGVQRMSFFQANSDGTHAFSSGKLALNSAHIGSDNSSPQVFSGNGAPEGVVTAIRGSTYHRGDGGAGTSFYVKESGSGNTGWVAK